MNPLQADFETFINNISTHQALFYQTATHLKKHKASLIKSFEEYDPEEKIMGSTMVIGDLTGETEKNFKINYPTDTHHIVHVGEIDSSIEELISREGMRSVAVCYEILETFLFDITASYLFHNQQQLQKADKLQGESINSVDESKDLIRRKFRSNDYILKLIRSLSQGFNDAESANNESLEIKEWYHVLSHVRHAIVHSLFKINRSRANFDKNRKGILNRYFSTKENKSFFELEMTKQESERQITLIAEYGFLIFKYLSIEQNYDWKVLMNRKKKLPCLKDSF